MDPRACLAAPDLSVLPRRRCAHADRLPRDM